MFASGEALETSFSDVCVRSATLVPGAHSVGKGYRTTLWFPFWAAAALLIEVYKSGSMFYNIIKRNVLEVIMTLELVRQGVLGLVGF